MHSKSLSFDRQQHYMAEALALSQLALPNCLPNPPVGCVLVNQNRIVATGYTRAPGIAHAEADALSRYDATLEGSCAFVTLEPCSFHGRTPSCEKALIHHHIKTVYIALTDPDPRNNGKGIALLREAGITVIEGVLQKEVIDFLAPYLQSNIGV